MFYNAHVPMRVLLIIDMQNDFATEGGSFRIDSSASVVDNIAKKVLNPDHNVWDVIIATKDFHPHDHISFSTDYSGFPPHCVQKEFQQFEIGINDFQKPDEKIREDFGQRDTVKARGGAKFNPDVLDALNEYNSKNNVNTEVFFKGFFKNFDSFGGVSYGKEYAYGNEHVNPVIPPRSALSLHRDCKAKGSHNLQSCLDAFTGSYQFPLLSDDIDSDPETGQHANINEAALDADAAFKTSERPLRLDDRIRAIIEECKTTNRSLEIRVCGLALDFCVQDTVINIKRLCDNDGYNADIKIIGSASGPADTVTYSAYTDPDLLAAFNGDASNYMEAEEEHALAKADDADKATEAAKVRPKLVNRQELAFQAYKKRLNNNRGSNYPINKVDASTWFVRQPTGGSAQPPRMMFLDFGLVLLVTVFASLVPR